LNGRLVTCLAWVVLPLATPTRLVDIHIIGSPATLMLCPSAPEL
jgi:hypothetical protein